MGGGTNLPLPQSHSTPLPMSSPAPLDILILGAGWTSTFLIPLLQDRKISYAATTTTGRDGTLEFKFDPELSDAEMKEQFKKLPTARGVLITFPLRGVGESGKLVGAYMETHGLKGKEDEEKGKESKDFHFIQLGSSGIWSIEGQERWVTRHSAYNKKDPRAIAEDELLALGGCVLDLSGLWGGERMVKHWIDRVAGTKEILGGKKSLHMVHGMDVARGIVGVFEGWENGKAKGERWMLTDLMVYDWWELILGYAGQIDEENGDREREGKQIKWIGELMQEQGVRALPRSMEELGRCYDTREFWNTFRIMPVKARI